MCVCVCDRAFITLHVRTRAAQGAFECAGAVTQRLSGCYGRDALLGRITGLKSRNGSKEPTETNVSVAQRTCLRLFISK